MGVNSSSIAELKDNEYLRRFVGKEAISHNDPFWNQLLSYRFVMPKTSADFRLLEENTSALCRTLLTNNLQTGNFGSLVRVFLLRAGELKTSGECENSVFTWQLYNTLFLLRCLCKYFIQTISEDNVVKQFEARSLSKKPAGSASNYVASSVPNIEYADEEEEEIGMGVSLLERFEFCVVEMIIDLPVVDFTYVLHLEAINTMLVLLSVQMYNDRPAAKSPIYRHLLTGKCSSNAGLLVKTLLAHYIRQERCPDVLLPENGHATGSNGVAHGLASGLWSVLTLGYGGGSKDDSANENGLMEMSDKLLANQSLFLVLILSFNCATERIVRNPYRTALFNFTNTEDTDKPSAPNDLPALLAFSLSYPDLYTILCRTLYNDQTTLLLYVLLHSNDRFRDYVFNCRPDLDQLIVPILRVLYSAQDTNCHHIYMSLIVLLILSEDSDFNTTLHTIVIKHPTWFVERSFAEITLGGLLILVLVRVIQYNIIRVRDRYLHTNCLAALANMSAHFKDLHPYVSQRIVSLFELLSKRQTKILSQIRQLEANPNPDPDEFEPELMQDLSVVEEVLRMFLEIINSCLTCQLKENSHFVYTLLYKRTAFEHFRTHPTFLDIIQNIDTVLNYFSQRVQKVLGDSKSFTVEQVLDVIQDGAGEWSPDSLQKFPEIKFKYVEENQPEDFFIPYIWSLAYNSSGIHWNSSNIRLFNVAMTAGSEFSKS